MVSKTRTMIREVLLAADPATARGYALVSRAFHKAELVRLQEWRNTLGERERGLWTDIRWHLLVAERAGQVIGVATGTYIGNVNIGVIGYLTVSRAARGLGVGPRLRERLRGLFKRDARRIEHRPLTAVIGEVRRDNPWLKTLVRRDRVLALEFDYLQPRLRLEESPVPLVLYYECFDRIRRRLSVPELRRLLYTIWRRVYRVPRPTSDAAFRRMLDQLSGRRSIGRLTLGDLRVPASAPARAGHGSRQPRR